MKTRANKGGQSITPRLSDFAKRLFATWKTLGLLITDGDVILAASGGGDSTALLLALDELIKASKLCFTLTVAHLDHGLRKASKDDAIWLKNLASELGYESVSRRAHVKKRAAKTTDNLEQAARRARYEFLITLAKRKGSTLVLTAHTLDDQAETILLRLLRGSAAEGLSGIEAVRPLEPASKIQVARPLLAWARRSDVENYCRLRRIDFRVDEMNADQKFARVKVRQQLLPLMQTFNNKIVEALSRTATLLREDADALSNEANKLLELATGSSNRKKSKSKMASLDVHILAGAPAAVRRRALRRWISLERGDLRRVEMVHLAAVDRLIEGGRGGRIAELPAGARVVRKRGRLELGKKS
jgi:tRNA(Ile)-lysidine synthase